MRREDVADIRPLLPPPSFGLLTAGAVCSLTFQCRARERRGDLGETESECRTRVADELNRDLLPAIENAVAAGQLRYQEHQYERYLGQVASAGCGSARLCVGANLEHVR
jgi:hypothetical protein